MVEKRWEVDQNLNFKKIIDSVAKIRKIVSLEYNDSQMDNFWSFSLFGFDRKNRIVGFLKIASIKNKFGKPL